MKTTTYPKSENSYASMPRFLTPPSSSVPCSFGICDKGLQALSKRDDLNGLDSITISRTPFKGSSLITRTVTNRIPPWDGSYWTHHGTQWFVVNSLSSVLINDFKSSRIYIRVNFTTPE